MMKMNHFMPGRSNYISLNIMPKVSKKMSYLKFNRNYVIWDHGLGTHWQRSRENTWPVGH